MHETFLEVEFEELSDDIRDKVEEGVKKRLNAINMFLENPKRMEHSKLSLLQQAGKLAPTIYYIWTSGCQKFIQKSS